MIVIAGMKAKADWLKDKGKYSPAGGEFRNKAEVLTFVAKASTEIMKIIRQPSSERAARREDTEC